MTKVLEFLMNEQNFNFIGSEFTEGNMCNHLIKFIYGDYLIALYVYRTKTSMFLQQSINDKIKTLNFISIMNDDKFKTSFNKYFTKYTLEAKNHNINNRLKKKEEDFV